MHTIFFFYMWLMKRYRISARHFRQNRHFSKGPFVISFALFYTLAFSAINPHFRHFCQIRHFHQNRHFPKGPFAISFEFLFTVWRFRRLIAVSTIFAKIATYPRAPLPSHLNFCLQFGNFGD